MTMECPDPTPIPPTCNILCTTAHNPLRCDTATMWEALQAVFTIPAIAGSAVVEVCSSAQYGIGAYIWIDGAGFFEVTGRPNTQTITVLNNGTPGNTAPATNIAVDTPFVQCAPPYVLPAVILDAILAAAGTQPTITVSDEATDVITVAVQVRDADGNALAEQCVLEIWISNAAAGALGTACSGAVAATTGAIIAEHTAKTHMVCITDANGTLVLTFTEAGGLVTYFNLNVQSKYVAGDQAMTWT